MDEEQELSGDWSSPIKVTTDFQYHKDDNDDNLLGTQARSHPFGKSLKFDPSQNVVDEDEIKNTLSNSSKTTQTRTMTWISKQGEKIIITTNTSSSTVEQLHPSIFSMD
jgi:hypothetical protein